MTDAILFNTLRGSGRNVKVGLLDVGLELASQAGEPIAIWPYDAIDLIKETSFQSEGIFKVPYDSVHTLRIADSVSWKMIVDRAPHAAQTLRASKRTLWDYVTMLPEPVQVGLWLGGPLALIYAIFSAWHWLSDIWHALIGG